MANARNIQDNATPSLRSENAQDLRESAHEAGRKLRKMIDSAGDELSQAGEVIGSEIRRNPVRSSLIALGVGFVLSALLRR